MKDLCGPRRIHLIVQRRSSEPVYPPARRMSRRHRQSKCRPSRREPILRHRLLRLPMAERHKAIRLHHRRRDMRARARVGAGGDTGSCPRWDQWAVAEVHQRDDEARRAVVRQRTADRQLERHLARGDIGLGVLAGVTGSITSLYTRTAITANNPFLSGMPPDQQQALNRVFSSAGPSFGSLITDHWGAARLLHRHGDSLRLGEDLRRRWLVPATGLRLHAVLCANQRPGAILGLVPILGGFAGFALWIYSIVLAVFAMMASQRLAGGRAVAAVLLPAIIVALLVCAFLFIAIAAIAALINGAR